MNIWFIETLNNKDNWIHYDRKNFYSFMEAYDYAISEGFNDDEYYWRISTKYVELNNIPRMY